MNNNFSNTPNYNPNGLPTLNGMNYSTAQAIAATQQNYPLYTTFNYFMVFTNLPDQPWPSYNLLQQCLEKVRARDARVYTSVDAIQRYGGAKTGDLILSFTAAAMTDGVIWTSAEGVILHQMRYWDRDRRMAGWGLVAAHGLAPAQMVAENAYCLQDAEVYKAAREGILIACSTNVGQHSLNPSMRKVVPP